MGLAGKKLSGRGLLVAGLTAGVLAAGGTAAAFAAGGDDDTVPSTPRTGYTQPVGADGGAAPRSSRIGCAQAAGAVLKAVPGGRIESLELDDDGRSLWEADVLTSAGAWREVHVDAGDGRVVADRADDPDDDSGRSAQALRSAKVDAVRAAAAAARTASGTVTSVEFEHRAARSVWEVEITGQDGRERELRVDAATGKVVADDSRDDDADDDSDDDAGDDD